MEEKSGLRAKKAWDGYSQFATDFAVIKAALTYETRKAYIKKANISEQKFHDMLTECVSHIEAFAFKAICLQVAVDTHDTVTRKHQQAWMRGGPMISEDMDVVHREVTEMLEEILVYAQKGGIPEQQIKLPNTRGMTPQNAWRKKRRYHA